MSNKTSVSLHNIKDVRSVEDLAVHYNLIKRHLFVLARRSGEDIEDLLQDFFINMHKYFEKYPDKVINGGFVSNSLRNMLRNYYVSVKRNPAVYEMDLVATEDNSEELELKTEEELKYDEMYSMVEELDWAEKTVLEYSLIMSVAELSRLSEIPYQNLVYALNCAKKKLGIKKM